MFPSPELVRHVDEIIRSNLATSRDWYLDRLQFSTVVVALGCAAEVPELIHELWPRLIPEKYERRVKILATAGLFVVIVGIAGEWFFEGRMTRYDGIIQTINDSILTDAQLRIAIAEGDAASAREKTEALGLETQVLHAEAETAKLGLDKEVAQAQERAEEFKQNNLKLEKSIEDERQRRVELAASLLPREFIMQDDAIRQLHSSPPLPVIFEFRYQDSECRRTAEQIAFVFDFLGWPFHRIEPREDFSPDINVRLIPSHPDLPPTANAREIREQELTRNMHTAALVIEALSREGWEVGSGGDGALIPPGNRDTLLIEVGEKTSKAVEESLKELGNKNSSRAGNRTAIPAVGDRNYPQ